MTDHFVCYSQVLNSHFEDHLTFTIHRTIFESHKMTTLFLGNTGMKNFSPPIRGFVASFKSEASTAELTKSAGRIFNVNSKNNIIYLRNTYRIYLLGPRTNQQQISQHHKWILLLNVQIGMAPCNFHGHLEKNSSI